jgi:hypothetical protein
VGAGHVALFTHDEFQLSGRPDLCRQTALFEFCGELAVCVALREVPQEFSKEFQPASFEMVAHEIEGNLL